MNNLTLRNILDQNEKYYRPISAIPCFLNSRSAVQSCPSSPSPIYLTANTDTRRKCTLITHDNFISLPIIEKGLENSWKEIDSFSNLISDILNHKNLSKNKSSVTSSQDPGGSMRNPNGYFKFYRKAVFEDIGQRGLETLGLWAKLLGMASYREVTAMFDGEPIQLQPGQMVTSLEELCCSQKHHIAKVRSALSYLEKTHRISKRSSSRGTLITINKWEEYYPQESEDADQITNESQTDDKPMTNGSQYKKKLRNKEIKNKELKGSTDPQKPTRQKTWVSYSDAYASRYGVAPNRDAKVNSLIKKIVESVGEEAIQLVQFFVRHQKTFYVDRMHDLGLCVADIQSLRTQMLTGVTVVPIQNRFQKPAPAGGFQRKENADDEFKKIMEEN